jgi:hypothetical protein
MGKKSPQKLMWLAMRTFGHGPYNPLHYKHCMIPEKLPTTEDMYANIKTFHSEPPAPIYNMRHLHPVRQSGPIPPYDGAWTMEDVKMICANMSVPYDHCPQSTDVEELMRRAPGLTRKEALRIQQLGLNPDEEVDFAYLTVNMGLDVFYERNQAYIARQVVTNSKGEKVEILWPCATYDEMTNMSFGTAEVWEYHENPWDPIPGELPIRIHPDYDLGVPYTWFEYEMDNRIHYQITSDQQYIPEDERPYPIDKNPHAHKYIWRPQEDMENDDWMRDPDWYPEGTHQNIYNRRDFKKEPNHLTEY